MRETRPSGSAGGEAALIGFPYPDQTSPVRRGVIWRSARSEIP